ncbi:MAG TPA: hypothetical protein VGC76_09290 [Pyrinomonadaceae bacterium]|jgi:hypothetical protein
MKRYIFTAIVFSLMFVFGQSITAQTKTVDKTKKSLKTLKNSLTKNSRYGDEIIYWFNPLNFKNCEVSYRFARLNENASDRFAAVAVDRTSPLARTNTVRNSELPIAQTTSVSQQNGRTTTAPQVTANANLSQLNARAKVFYNNSFPYYYYGIDRRTFYMEQVVTIVDLSEIDPNSIKLRTSPFGQEYVFFNSFKDKSGIGKQMFGNKNDMIEVESDFVPVSDKKSAQKISSALVEAVNACRE